MQPESTSNVEVLTSKFERDGEPPQSQRRLLL